jgi:hypothetical protein
MDASVEQINDFIDTFDELNEEVSGIVSLEDLANDLLGMDSNVSFSTMMKVQDTTKSTYLEQCIETCDESKAEPVEIVREVGNNDYITIVDISSVYEFAFDGESKPNMYQQLTQLTKDDTLSVISCIPFHRLNGTVIFDGLAYFNAIATLPCKTTYRIDTKIGFIDLMLAMRCDDVIVGEFGTLSIEYDQKANVPACYKFMYDNIVDSTYEYWIGKGLITQEEVDNLSNDVNKYIHLSSKEMMNRLSE